MKNMQATKKNQGFTLIELMIVILILGILGVVADRAYTGYKENAKSFGIKNIVYGIDKEIKSLAEHHGLSKSATGTGLVNNGNTYIDVIRYGKDFVTPSKQTSYEYAPHVTFPSISVTTPPSDGVPGVYNIEGMELEIIAGNSTHNAYQVSMVDTGVLSNYIDKYNPEITFDHTVARTLGTELDYTAANSDGQHTVTVFIKR